jgi:hypothetical protein
VTLQEAQKQNCVLAALAALTGRPPHKILGDICASAEDWVIDFEGYMNRRTYLRYLELQGWTVRVRGEGAFDGPIPQTCLLVFDGHAFALVNGAIFDTGTASRWGRELIVIAEPPK